MTEGPEWVTVAEAARCLGLSERQTRRLISRLPESDRQTPAGSPARVRLSALSVRPESGREADSTSHQSQNVSGASPAYVRPESGVESGPSSDMTGALLEQLRSEVTFLRTELQAQREASETAQSELRRLMMADKQELLELRQRLAIVARPDAQADAGTAETAETVKETGAKEKPVETSVQGQKRKRWQFWRQGR